MTMSQEDRRIIINTLNRAYQEAKNRIFIFVDRFGIGEKLLRTLLPPFSEILRNVPECAKKYKVEEIIEILSEAYYNRELLLP